MILPLAAEHVSEVAGLHARSLNGLLSELGPRATLAYYAGCVRAPAAIGRVWVSERVVRGFVLGSARPGALRREALGARPLATLAGMLAGFARRPSTLGWTLKSFRGPAAGSYDAGAAELTYLAVAADRRGAGIGAQLVGAFGQALRDASVGAYELSVNEDNPDAIAFYRRLGFREVGRYREFGRFHRRYRLELGPEAPPAPGDVNTS